MKSRSIIPPLDCTGCGLCANVCSQNAISMVYNDEGFLVPQVDEAKCINCGLCSKRCIVLSKPQKTESSVSPLVYGAWNLDRDILLRSSSGGIFSAVAEFIFQERGCVFGVVWQDSLNAVFAKAETMDELAAMRGSKYVQARVGFVYRDVKAELKRGRKVLFVGTSCQVRALRSLIRNDDANLFTIDILCHGVPSHWLIERYVEWNEQKAGKKIFQLSFRDKTEGWLQYAVKRIYEDGATSSVFFGDDDYMKIFLSDTALNRVCYHCPFADLPRQGDLSLGDYWGVNTVHPEWPIDYGIASIMVNSPRGESMIRQLPGVELRKDRYENMYHGQPNTYVRPTSALVHPNREEMIRILRDRSLGDALKLLSYRKIGGIKINTNSILYRALRKTNRLLKRFLKP